MYPVHDVLLDIRLKFSRNIFYNWHTIVVSPSLEYNVDYSAAQGMDEGVHWEHIYQCNI